MALALLTAGTFSGALNKEAILAMEHEPGVEVTVFFLDLFLGER